MTWNQDLNRIWIAQASEGLPPENDAAAYGVTIAHLPNIVSNAMRVIGVHHLSGAENGGNHNIYCDVLNPNGNRMHGAVLEMHSEFISPVTATVDKPDNEPGANFPYWDYGPLTVKVKQLTGHSPDTRSDSVSGMHYKHADEGVGNTYGHHSFYIVFQLLASAPVPQPPIDPPKPPIDPPTSPPLDWRLGGEVAFDDEYQYYRVRRVIVDAVEEAYMNENPLRWTDASL